MLNNKKDDDFEHHIVYFDIGHWDLIFRVESAVYSTNPPTEPSLKEQRVSHYSARIPNTKAPSVAGRTKGSESLVPLWPRPQLILPGVGGDARLPLRSTRSHGRSWFPGLPAEPCLARTTALAAGRRGVGCPYCC